MLLSTRIVLPLLPHLLLRQEKAHSTSQLQQPPKVTPCSQTVSGQAIVFSHHTFQKRRRTALLKAEHPSQPLHTAISNSSQMRKLSVTACKRFWSVFTTLDKLSPHHNLSGSIWEPQEKPDKLKPSVLHEHKMPSLPVEKINLLLSLLGWRERNSSPTLPLSKKLFHSDLCII